MANIDIPSNQCQKWQEFWGFLGEFVFSATFVQADNYSSASGGGRKKWRNQWDGNQFIYFLMWGVEMR